MSRNRRELITAKKYVKSDEEIAGLSRILEEIRALREKAINRVAPLPM